MMIKTVSEDCNLACEYCYYSHVLGRPHGIRVPSFEVLDKLLSDYLATCGSVASITWQGGEPLLAGWPFFHRAVALEVRHARKGMILSNALQTNGTLINQDWAQFFHDYRFLVGVSLDGPDAMHNRYRVDAGGRGSFNRVMRGIEWLKRERVEFNILTVIGPHNVHHGQELMQFYRQEHFDWVQFIPQMRFPSQNVEESGVFAISPEEYGQFLCDVFDLWYNGGNPTMSMRYFDNVLQTYANQVPDICTMQSHCPQFLVLESNGDIFACDFYMDQNWKMGNILEMHLAEVFRTERYQGFSTMKPSLPLSCQTCPWLKHCQGGCPRNRTWDPSQSDTADYFCESFKQFFPYADERLKKLAQRLRQTRTTPGPLPI